MVTLKTYAKTAGITYEAVRQKVKRYEAELAGHIHTQGKTQYLDDVAVEFLDGHKAATPVVVYDRGRDEHIQELENTIAQLTNDLEQYKTKLITAQETIISVQGQLVEGKAALLQLQAANDTATAAQQHAQEAAQNAAQAAARADSAEDALKAAQDEIERLKARGWWQRLTRSGE